MQFRYYNMENGEQVLPLLGENWRRAYGKGINELHFHNYMEIGICYDGCGNTILGDYVTNFEGGCMCIIPANYPHNNISKDGTLAYWEWMYFDIEKVLLDMKEMSSSKMDEEYLLTVINSSPLFFYRSDHKKISNIIMEIRNECDRKDYLYWEKTRGLLQTFVVELLRIQNIISDMPRKNPRSVEIVPALNYVKVHYREDLRIRDLAEVCNISESHFRRVFKDCMDVTPCDYVNMIRINEANNLMLVSHSTMEEIAFQVGYSNVSTFNRNYKKLIGMTPYQWKRSPENRVGQMSGIKSTLKGWM